MNLEHLGLEVGWGGEGSKGALNADAFAADCAVLHWGTVLRSADPQSHLPVQTHKFIINLLQTIVEDSAWSPVPGWDL